MKVYYVLFFENVVNVSDAGFEIFFVGVNARF